MMVFFECVMRFQPFIVIIITLFKVPFIWSRVPETTLPRVTLAEVGYSLFLCKINQPFTSGSRTHLGGRDNSGERVVSPRQVG